MESNRKTGSRYEDWVAVFLEKRGYRVLERNYYTRSGEIDIIAKEGNALVFIEVKFRRTDKQGDPLEAVTLKKQKNIRLAARIYMMKNGIDEDTSCRFDVAAILGSEVTVIQNAF